MHCRQWIFDMDGTLTDSMGVVWEGAPDALLRRYGRTPKENLRSALLTMGMQEGAQYLIREYDLPLSEDEYYGVMREVIAELYETVELKPGVREMLARLRAEGARICLCSNTWADQCRTVLRRLGVLDDLTEAEVEAQFSFAPGENYIVTEMPWGSTVHISEEKAKAVVLRRAQEHFANGADTVLVLCTGDFDRPQVQGKLFLLPEDLMFGILSGLRQKRMGFIVPNLTRYPAPWRTTPT